MQSEKTKGEKAAEIMDVNAGAVAKLLSDTQATCLIHGHTHQPARHALEVDGKSCERWVLSDWHDKATWLEAGTDGLIARKEV
jgi:UDP-2,3-diacylglucosamine hydrolase